MQKCFYRFDRNNNPSTRRAAIERNCRLVAFSSAVSFSFLYACTVHYMPRSIFYSFAFASRASSHPVFFRTGYALLIPSIEWLTRRIQGMFRALPDTPPVLAIGDNEIDKIIQEDYLWEDLSERRSAPGEAEEDENFELTDMRFRQPSPLDLEEHLPYRLNLLTSCVADSPLDWEMFRTYFNSNTQ